MSMNIGQSNYGVQKIVLDVLGGAVVIWEASVTNALYPWAISPIPIMILKIVYIYVVCACMFVYMYVYAFWYEYKCVIAFLEARFWCWATSIALEYFLRQTLFLSIKLTNWVKCLIRQGSSFLNHLPKLSLVLRLQMWATILVS